ncbi:MAG TPA: type II toxin-antitoxin system VapC family toxin [Herpetosiphonaceae bacterium]|nr:type II toxin-antitoxin system VapC family toxin [Herpetosiphonaceae bacterium]
MKILDTDILLDHLQGSRAALEYLSAQMKAGETLALSVITLAEVLSSVRYDEEAPINTLLRLFFVLDITESVARQASVYLRQFRASHGLAQGDALIAATAYFAGAELITRNTKRYPMDDITAVAPY